MSTLEPGLLEGLGAGLELRRFVRNALQALNPLRPNFNSLCWRLLLQPPCPLSHPALPAWCDDEVGSGFLRRSGKLRLRFEV